MHKGELANINPPRITTEPLKVKRGESKTFNISYLKEKSDNI